MAVGVTLVKKFTYKGQPEEWSNKYHFTGTNPADSAAWLALTDALILQEKTLYGSSHQIVRAYGYDDDSSTANSVYQRDMSLSPINGTLASVTQPAPGDAATWIRWKTSRTTSKGRVIYLRKYYHGVNLGGSLQDSIATGQVTALTAFAAKMWDGTFLDGRKLRAAGQTTETILGASVSPYVGYRQLRRGTRRPG